MEFSYITRRNRNWFAGYKLRKRCEAVYERLRQCTASSAPSVLDIGACDGRMLSYIKSRSPGAVCEGVEPDERFLAQVSDPGIRVRLGRAEKLDFKDGIFDMAVMSSVLEHIADAGAGLAEARRVLKPGGALCVITVFPLYEKITVLSGMKTNDHFRNYSLSELEVVLSEAGFSVLEAGPMPFPLFYNLVLAGK